MSRLHKLISLNEKFILFLSGVIVSAVVSGFLEKTITRSDALLTTALILLVITSLYYFRENNLRLQRLADNIEIPARYEQEPYDEGTLKGTVFEKLAELVSEAKERILILDTTFIAGKESKSVEHPARSRFLRTIEKVVENKQRSGSEFEYVYINQIPRGIENPLSCFDTETFKHCHRILELERHFEGSRLSLGVVSVPAQRLTNFMIVDKKHIVLEVDGIDSGGNPYAVGMFFLEDRHGELINTFHKYFRSVERLGQSVPIAAFMTRP